MSQFEPPDGRISIAAPDISEPAGERVAAVLDSGSLASGSEVEAFEAAFAEYCDTEHAIATANGTAALHTALVAAGIGDGDVVVTTPLSFVATANAVRFCGAVPVFADVNPATLNLDPDAVRETIEAIDGVVDAILPVHLYGLPAAMDELSAIAAEHDAALIEDAAQAHGATYRGDPVGSLGAVGTFSFYPTKNMTTGEGGMVVTDDDTVAARARRFINHGRDGSGQHVSLGHNFRLTDIAAAIGRVQLDRLPQLVLKRRDHADRLSTALENSGVQTPPTPAGRKHAFHQYTIRTDDRDELAAFLEERGIATGVYYPTPIHRQPAYDHRAVDAPNAERASEEVLSLPVHPKLPDAGPETIGAALKEFDG